MNILGIGGAELILVILIALVVAGPQRMVKWAFTLGQWAGKIRRAWEQMADAVQREIDAAGVDVKIPKEPPTRQSLNRAINQAVKPITAPIEETLRETEGLIRPPAPSAPPAPAPKAADASTIGGLGSWAKLGQAPAPATPPTEDLGNWSQPQAKGD